VDGFDYGSYPTDGVNYQKLETKGGNIRLKYNLNDITLHSITGYETLKFNSRADVDGGYGAVFAPPSGPGYIPFPVETADLLPNHKQFSQEFRAESNYAGPLQWIGGLFFFNESIQIDSISFNSPPGNPQNAAYAQQFQNAKSWAAFGSLNYTVTDKFKVRGGLRYTTTRKSSRARTDDARTRWPVRDRQHLAQHQLGPERHLRAGQEHQPVRPRGNRLPRAIDAGPPEWPGRCAIVRRCRESAVV
jgi:iron complex outermembrane receptor protein